MLVGSDPYDPLYALELLFYEERIDTYLWILETCESGYFKKRFVRQHKEVNHAT
jgi:hypothetical protein